MKILTVVGARPQFIKTGPISTELDHRNGCEEILVHTGQHYDANMSDVFFDELELRQPDYQLAVGSSSHGKQTGEMLVKIEECINTEQPDCVLVYGDTNSTLAAALASSKMHVPVAHVEAGLRSFNRKMPEEINRVVTDHLSDFLFAPTPLAVENLIREGRPASLIINVGDVMQDVALLFGKRAKEQSKILNIVGVIENEFVLVTFHRAENTDVKNNLAWIVDELIKLSVFLPVVIPLHPRTKKSLENQNLFEKLDSIENISFTKPLGYLDMVRMEQTAKVVVTDSGGVQKEAYFHDTPCVTLRCETEWVELVETGWNTLCPPCGADSLIDVVSGCQPGKTESQIYGDGSAGKQIVNELLTHFPT